MSGKGTDGVWRRAMDLAEIEARPRVVVELHTSDETLDQVAL
jgi:hypothetical protein